MVRVLRWELAEMVAQINAKMGNRGQDKPGCLHLDYTSTCGGQQYGGYKITVRVSGGGLGDYWPIRRRVTAGEMAAFLEGSLMHMKGGA